MTKEEELALAYYMQEMEEFFRWLEVYSTPSEDSTPSEEEE